MAITFFDTTNDEKLINYIKEKFSTKFRGKALLFYIIDDEDELAKIPKNKKNMQIIITKNCTSDFVNKALEITSNVIYKFEDFEKIETKILNLIN